MPCSCKKCCVVEVPCVPECRKSIKDKCRIKPCPPCDCCCEKPKKCVRKTKCHLPSVKDACRVKPCPPPCCDCCDCC